MNTLTIGSHSLIVMNVKGVICQNVFGIHNLELIYSTTWK